MVTKQIGQLWDYQYTASPMETEKGKPKEEDFAYEPDNNKGVLHEKDLAVAKNSVNDILSDPKTSYVINIPTEPKGRIPSILEKYRKQGFKDPNDSKTRLAIIFGVNSFASIDGVSKQPELTTDVAGVNGFSAFRAAAFGYTWTLNWIEKDTGKAINRKKVEQDFVKLSEKDKKKVKSIESKSLKQNLPYDLFRNIINKHNLSKEFVSEFAKSGGYIYLNTSDPDVMALITDDSGRTDIDLGVDDIASGLFDIYDQLIKKYTDPKTGEPPAIASGGYFFTLDLDENTEPDAIRIAANKLDMAVRSAMAKVNPFTVYFPEPNTIYKIKKGQNSLEVTFSPSKTASKPEGQAAVRGLRQKRKLQKNNVAFDLKAAILTDSDRFGAKVNGKIVNVNINWQGGPFPELTEEKIKAILLGSSQTHIQKNYWIRRVYSQYQGPKEGRGTAITEVYTKLMPHEIFGMNPTKLIKELPSFDAKEHVSNLSDSTIENLAGDKGDIIEIGISTANTIAMFLKEILGIYTAKK